MKILAVEFSSEQRSVAIVANGEVLGHAMEAGGRTARAFALIDRALSAAGLEREAIDCLAIGLGPGSYAGIRAAIALAQGWQLAREVRLLGLGSVECLAEQARTAKLTGPLNILIDAQRGEFYSATYELDATGCRLLQPLRIISLAEAQSLGETGSLIIGPDLLPRFPQGQVHFPDASTLGQLAAKRTNFLTGDKLEPIYLREASFVKAPPLRVIPSA